MPRLWARVASVLVVLVSLIAALAAAFLASYWLAAWVESAGVLSVVAVLVFALVAGAGITFAARLWGPPINASRRWVAVTLLTVVFTTSLYVVLLRPVARVPSVIPYGDTRYWRLPTGSRVAYSEIDPPQGVAVRPLPIVFVHGGPGLRQAPFDQRAYGAFAADGFRVFLYDQAGSGLSDFLPHVRDYTVKREVADLEAVRQAIGAQQMILIGHSWGSTLAASYIAAHPDRVAKVVFHSPGRIWNTFSDSVDFSRTDAGATPLPNLRLVAGLLLRDRNPNTAERFLSQREAEALVTPAFRTAVGTLVCKGHSGAFPPDLIAGATEGNLGFNPYVLQQLASEVADASEDPHAALRANPTPAILLYPECNYLSWGGALDYRRTFRHLEIFYIPHAGHYIQLEQPEQLHRVIRAFLLNGPDAIPPVTGDADPRPSNAAAAPR